METTYARSERSATHRINCTLRNGNLGYIQDTRFRLWY